MMGTNPEEQNCIMFVTPPSPVTIKPVCAESPAVQSIDLGTEERAPAEPARAGRTNRWQNGTHTKSAYWSVFHQVL